MKRVTPLIASAVALLTLTACVDPNAYPNDPNARQKGGAVTGALIGGFIGAQSSDDKLLKAAAGATLGGIVGAAIGADFDRQARELRAQMSGNSTVTQTDNGLLVTMGQDILFATDSATLRYDQLGDLNAVAASLQRYPDSRIEIVGHTDHDGDAAYNQDLSERRARAVQAALQQAGVPAARLTAIGRGESQPVASNYTAQGKAANRRVEIFIRGNR